MKVWQKLGYEVSLTLLTSLLKQLSTFSHTSSTVICSHSPKRCFDCLIGVETYFVDQTIQPSSVEYGLDSTKHRFYRIELRAVGHVVDWEDIELEILLLDHEGLVNGKLIHKESKRTLGMLSSKILQVQNEIISCDCWVMNTYQADSVLFSHGCNDWSISSVDVFLIDSEIGVPSRPISNENRSLREIDLIQIDDLSIPLSCFCDLLTSIDAVDLELLTQVARHVFLLSDFFAHDSMSHVQSS